MFTALGVAFKTLWGCTKLSFRALKLGVKLSRGLVKGGWRAFKTGRKLGKGVFKVIKKSRSIAQQAIQKGMAQTSHVFTNPEQTPTSNKEWAANVSKELKTSNIFTKND